MTDNRDELFILSENKERICSICGKSFVPRIPSINVIEEEGTKIYVCSFQCRSDYFSKSIKMQKCNYCGKEFKPKYAFQTFQTNSGSVYYFCTTECHRSFIDDIKKEELRQNGIDKMTENTRKIAVFTQKGGTGKTTTAFNVSAALAEMGYKVLLIDGDPQGNISISLGLKPNAKQKTLYDVFIEEIDISDAIYKQENSFDLIISDQKLAAVNITLARDEDPKNRHKVLKQKLSSIEKKYDYIIMDCSPALSVLNHNLLYFSEEVLIPVSCDYLSMAGLKQVLATLEDVKKYFNHTIEVIGIVPTFYIRQQVVSRKVYNDLKTQYHDLILSPIRESVSIRLSAFDGEAVVLSKKHSKSAGEVDYHALADTITKRKTEKRVKIKE